MHKKNKTTCFDIFLKHQTFFEKYPKHGMIIDEAFWVQVGTIYEYTKQDIPTKNYTFHTFHTFQKHNMLQK